MRYQIRSFRDPGQQRTGGRQNPHANLARSRSRMLVLHDLDDLRPTPRIIRSE
jgi:hypothetical protein